MIGRLSPSRLRQEGRGTGLATALMRATVERLHAESVVASGLHGSPCAALLHCMPANTRARRFYERCGFVLTGEVRASGHFER